MSAFDYAPLATRATAMLARFGQLMTLRNYTTGTYDPATGTNTATYTDTTRRAALFDFAAGQIEGPGGLIQGGDKMAYMAPGAPVPSLEDHLIDAAGVEWVIKGIQTIAPAETAVLYILHLRT